ncbi:MOSC domain-containing protein [Paenibacillus apis]|uniref:MOSC domain-containing protein n=1 Tax=Paenibacillus apis TaxID=1792174 RepID=A0A919Y8P5_9BACL|nr:MOSC domain-containing protein [Paenibacillus apis]GIO44568.1 hypothetical protein J41TS4_43260 [Paenibacillus apis]
MKSAEILSLNTGKPAPLMYNNREVASAIKKLPVTDAIFLSHCNFDGDEQADLVNHGGRDKAVCVYPYEHYPYWEGELTTRLEMGAFGENLTTKGLLETEVCIGDIYLLGEAVVQISQPRQPCYKLAARYGAQDMPLKVQETGFTGFYFRVLKEGKVSREDRLILEKRHPMGVTVSFANRIKYIDKENQEAIRTILAVEELSDSWRASLSKRLHAN